MEKNHPKIFKKYFHKNEHGRVKKSKNEIFGNIFIFFIYIWAQCNILHFLYKVPLSFEQTYLRKFWDNI